MECLLQCQLWRWDESSNDEKVIAGGFRSREYIKEYFKQAQEKGRRVPGRESFSLKPPVTIDGMLVGCGPGYFTIFEKKDKEANFHNINMQGEILETIPVPGDILTPYSLTKTYAGRGLIGLLTKQDAFALYDQEGLYSVFPAIHRTVGFWHAYLSDNGCIFMDGACYDVKTGEKEWDFPLPMGSKEYKHFWAQEMWRELPTGMLISQINVDQEIIYLSLIDQSGALEKTISMI